MFVFIGHIHEVFLEGVIVVVFKTAWREFAGDDVDGWTWKASTTVFPEVGANAWRTAEARW